jgi:outer membrane protein OmpA-like peptidoglycan-associated protein
MAGIRGESVEQSSMNAEEVRERYAGVIAAQPRKPRTFTLFFVFDSDELTDESKTAFEQVRAEVASWPGAEVVITGHTDRVGTVEYNDALSLKRAAMVAKRLAAAGVPAEWISVAGRGEREPIVPTRDEAAEPRNRRVELKVR